MLWRFLSTDPPAADGVFNMACDEALMTRAETTGEAVFRVYGWSRPTLSFGRNQRARGLYDTNRASHRGVDIVRRPTGGRALLHAREVTYSATLPVAERHPNALRRAYDFINAVLLDALRSIGVQASMSLPSVEARNIMPGLRPCFDVPSSDEIVLGSRKLVGSAQWRHRGALLQHGSILVHDDQSLVTELLSRSDDARAGGAEPAMPVTTPRAATLAEALGGEPTFADVAGSLRAALRRTTGAEPTCVGIDGVLHDEIDRLSGVYRSAAWTWRR